MTTDVIGPDLMTTLRRLKLGRLLDTLPDRLALARQQKMAHQDFLLLLLSDEVSRRDSASGVLRAARAQLDPQMQIEQWDPSSKVTYDQALLNELISLRFVEAHAHVALVGPVGVGKTFLAHALGHMACRRGSSVLVLRADRHVRPGRAGLDQLRRRVRRQCRRRLDLCVGVLAPAPELVRGGDAARGEAASGDRLPGA